MYFIPSDKHARRLSSFETEVRHLLEGDAN